MTSDHKNQSRAPLKPFDVPTAALSVGGLGFLRPAPGTWGSIPPVAAVALLGTFGASAALLVGVSVAILVLASAACVGWGGYAEQRFGRKDAAEVVADETAGVCLPLIVALFATPGGQTWALAAAFVAFRFFDIAKPWPAKRLERVAGGWGVLLDDLVAGVYAAALVGAFIAFVR